MSSLAKLDQSVLPNDLKAEQMLLGSILINPEVLLRITEFLKADHFFELLHRKIFDAIISVSDKGFNPSQITVKTVLDKEESFKLAGGADYLSKLASSAITVINPYEYGRLIFDLSVKRSLIALGQEIIKNAYDTDVTYDASLQIEQAESKLYHLAESGTSDKGFISLNHH
jgi:replicative DNA helicase